MARSKALGLGIMFVLLVLAVVALPIVIRILTAAEPHFVAGFQDMKESHEQRQDPSRAPSHVDPSVERVPQLPSWRPDPNTDYVCRSPHGSDQPCPEGTFCDGASQSCVSNYVGGNVPTTGYYA